MNLIRIRGARTHNLKNIDIDIPRDQLIVITGLFYLLGTVAFDIEPGVFPEWAKQIGAGSH